MTDNRTGLVWLKNANCIGGATEGGAVDWHTAMEFVAGLSDDPGDIAQDCGLSDGSSPGEWRLPSAAEWEAMVADALGEDLDPDCAASPPTITDDSGQGCWVSGTSSFTGVESSTYFSVTTSVNDADFAWYVSLTGGGVSQLFGFKTTDRYVWPVRGGQ